MDDEVRFRKLLGEWQRVKGRTERVESELKRLVAEIAQRQHTTAQQCLQRLMQKVLDDDAGRFAK